MLKEWSRLFYRYLISYLVVLVLPVVIIYAYFYASFINSLREEEITSYYNAVTQTRIQLDSRLDEIQNIALQISVTPYITQLPANGFQLKQELKKYEAVNQLSHEIILYLHNQDRLYSSQSSYTLSTFVHNIYHFPSWDRASFYTDLRGLRAPIMRPAEHLAFSNMPSERLITYLMPFPVNSRAPYGTMLFMLKESVFRQLLRNALHEDQFNALIVDRDANLIMALAPQEYMNSVPFRTLLAHTEADGTQMVRMVDKEYVVVHSASLRTALSYIFIIPSAVVMDKVLDVQRKMLYMLIVVLSAGFVIIYWLMHINYNPISELVKVAARGLNSGRPLTELDTIRTAITRMEETTLLLRQKVAVSQPIVREHLIIRLLNGTIADREELANLLDLPQVGSTHSSFVVIKFVFQQGAGSATLSITALFDDLLAKLPPALVEFGSYRLGGKTLILIVQTEQPDAILLEEQLTVLYHYLSVKWEINMAVGIGSGYADVGGIATSYFESSTAADYLLIKGLNGVRHFVQIDFVNSIVQWYPEQHMQSLEWYLQQWDVDRIEVTLKEIAEKIKGEDTPIYLVRCLCFNILNLLIREIYQVKRERPHLREEYYDIVALTQFETIDGLIEEVLRISRAVVRTIEVGETQPLASLEIRMKEYIEQHYGEATFTIYSVAAHFAITPTYLRRIFKRHTGITVSEYVELLRIQQASHLLKESDENLGQIVYKIGYVNVSSFIRKFRQQTGMTPGEYRNRHRV
jgi:AraC-like DNA-binding protein